MNLAERIPFNGFPQAAIDRAPPRFWWMIGAVVLLLLSAVKRSLGAKDWGEMIEGHGDALDRLDSVVFAAPIFFHTVRYGFQ